MAESVTASRIDPYNTAELRRRVLAAWADAPARFREDANAEEDFALGGYRDRVVVELAQNAADAARRAGVPGRLRLSLDGSDLTAANTGEPLTAEGVESLATLRASTKRDDHGSAGRFGVGFSAVAALSDDVTVRSGGSAVRFDAERARAAVADLLAGGTAHADLAEEVRRRSGHVPMLRLPFPGDADGPTDDYDTVVTLRLRDEATVERVRELLERTGEALVLALPGLAEVQVAVDGTERVVTRQDLSSDDADLITTLRDAEGTRTTLWRVLTRSGSLDPDLLTDRPTEERGRTGWTLTWAVPVDEDGALATLPADVDRVVHAPTPTDTELDLPAVLIGTFPLGSDRRAVQPGPATDQLLAEAADAYCALLRGFHARAALDLVPGTRVGGGAVDAAFRARVAEPLRDTPFLVTAAGSPVPPRDAVLLDTGGSGGAAGVTAVLAELVPQLLPGTWSPRHPALAALRVHRLGLADLADLIADTDRPPHWWAELYSALADAGGAGADLDELGALPVPLADGRLVRGPRSLLLPSDDWERAADARDHSSTRGAPSSEERSEQARATAPEPSAHESLAALSALGVRVVHPEAVHPLLRRLGAVDAGAAAVLADPRTEAAVRDSLDAEDPEPVAEAVLDLVAASGTTVADAPWLAELALRDDEDGYSVAGELLVPGAPLAELLVDDAPFGTVHADLVERHGTETLRAVGALWELTVVRAHDAALGDDLVDEFDGAAGEGGPDGLEDWADEMLERVGDPDLPPVAPELVCVVDLDYIADDQWPRALAMLSRGPLREAVTTPARIVLPDGRVADVPSYTAWWLRTRALVGGRAPVELRTADADTALAGLYDVVPADVDPEFARALGVRRTLDDLVADPDGPDDLLARMADPDRHVDRAALRRVWAALAEVDTDLVTPPSRVRAVIGGAIVVADAEDALVLDSPDLLPLLEDRPLVLAPTDTADAVADVLDLAMASEAVTGEIGTTGQLRPVPDEAALFLEPDDEPDRTYLHHPSLTVDGVEVEWYAGDGTIHAATPEGLARALCWRAGQWSRRHAVAAVLRDPSSAARLLAESDLD
ncbi:sacsin N-terminal ATP-binding-like domain-containing protein [Nocardiopsis sp. NRRL B-16309]|uniref:sacsin N-terminal ATP-binding-like domain-containing protein n=1 Tax=Nocardiopsis sp. NRRL B-16309 TaxID=1519494 RepID=UPI0006B025F5|nr:ATP-binding protein [Nocardiopsis sp. NRRL B-16309]KOX16979.1 ATPase [Nocardiopsis sp. NRRL B-16309]